MINQTMKRCGNLLMSGALCAALLLTGTLAGPASSAQAMSWDKAQNIIASGEAYWGTPYRYGATYGSTRYFDCSSFVKTVFEENGIWLPRSSKEMSGYGWRVPKSELEPGDLVFFYSPIHHVGIYIGDGKFIHTYGEGGVTIDDLNSGWWERHYTMARRVA